ncbi:MAG TPA: aldose epimerase family protein [Kineosporiaceae bacterium]|nr:aldose epimerase family protein [Kineosporiaceae bacterium]
MGEPFGTLADGTSVERYTLRSDALEVGVLSYGGVLQSLLAPDRSGHRADVVLGFADAGRYEADSPFFGAIVGRYANRIGGARFVLDGEIYPLTPTDGPNTLHGGQQGFDARVWSVEEVPGASGPAGLRLSLVSPNGDQGFPARLSVAVTYRLDGDSLRLDYRATNEEAPGGLATVVNLTNHAYWNLAGEGAGSIGDHELWLNASGYLPTDATSIPAGGPAPVEGTPFDFCTAAPIGARWRAGVDQLALAGGYDHTYLLDGAAAGVPQRAGLPLAAVVTEPVSGRVLEVWTDQPGVQFYTGNHLTGQLRGKSGRLYRQGDAFCLETQHWPDAPNRPDFPSTVVRPQQTFRTSTIFRLTTA